MKDWLFRAAAHIPNRVWGVFGDESCLLPYYHMVSDETVPHVSPLYRFRSVQEFEADLDYFLRDRQPLSLQQFVSSVRGKGAPPKQTFLVTFDDGFRQMSDIVTPILVRKGVPAVFFLNTATLDNQAMCHHQKIGLVLERRKGGGREFPEATLRSILGSAGLAGPDTDTALRSIPWKMSALLDEIAGSCGLDFSDYLRREQPYLTSPQVDAMLRNGMAIGAHSIDHPRYADISMGEQLRQTRDSMEALVKQFDLNYRAFAFPHTDHGVSRAFFETVLGERTLDVSFGTSGPAADVVQFNFQRFSMEKSRLPARAALARQRMKRLELRATGSALLERPNASGLMENP